MIEKKHVYKLDDGENWWLVATSAEEALRIGADDYEIRAEYDHETVTCEQVPDDQSLAIAMLDDRPEDVAKDAADGRFPEGAIVAGQKVAAPAGAWASSGTVGEMIGSTVY